MNEATVFLLSPYRPPTTYPVSLATEEVRAWLNGYSALWHPAVLRKAARPPQPASVYDHDQPGEQCIFARPEAPTLYQPDDWQERVQKARSVAFLATANRAETFANLREALTAANRWFEVDPELALLFSGLGYSYLMIDTLFDAMNHEKLLDEPGFWQDIQNAIAALQPGHEVADCRSCLQEAAQKLLTAREGAYSGTIALMEWIVPDAQNLEAPWPASLTRNRPVSVLVPGETLERMAVEAPERFAELKAKAPADLPAAAELCVGAYRERDDALLPIESQLGNLRRGRETTQRLFGIEPTVFARMRSAYHPQLPSWLQESGYQHGLAVSFDGAVVPARYSAVIGWPGPDGKSINVFTREPLAAGEPTTFFNLAYHLHQAISNESTPTLALLHRKPPAAGYEEFLAAGELAPLFGQPMTLSQYFAETYAGDYVGVSTADEFFADSLDDRVTHQHRPDAVSGFAHHARLRRRLDTAYALLALHRSLSSVTEPDDQLHRQLQEFEDAMETRGAEPGIIEPTDELAAKLQPLEQASARRLAERIQVRAAANQPGFLLFNPCSFPRRAALELPAQAGPIPLAGSVKASEWAAGLARVVVEVPGLGFTWIPRGSAATPMPKARIKTAEGTLVRNEFFEAELDPVTGALRAFRDTRTRMNRLGAQLVFNPGSSMIATSVHVTHAGSALGEVTAEGNIVNEHGEPLAGFRQRLRAWIGRPALELRIELTPIHRPTGYPWHAFYAARFAWRDERAATFRGVHGMTCPTTHARPLTSDFLEIRVARERSFLFTGGLPFLQRQGTRMMDVILIPEGETATSFDLLLATDRDHPMQTAQGWITPTPVVETTQGPPHIGESGWLAALDLPSLLLTSLKPQRGARQVVGRFMETAGFAGAAEWRFARDPKRAQRTNLLGHPRQEIPLVDGAIPLEFSAHELATVLADWTE